jgi:spoIIIJ-associated protein
LLVARGGELLQALEMITVESVGDMLDEHDRISFDSMGFRQARTDELVMSANVAAEKVRKTGTPYAFTPMNSRERRVVHLALRDVADLRTESEGEGPARHLVVYPKDYKGRAPASPAAGRPAPRRGR